MFGNGTWRIFLAGVLCGAIFTAVGGAAWVRWKPRPEGPTDWPGMLARSDEDDALYDACLSSGRGTVACDALMRMNARNKKEAAQRAEEEQARIELLLAERAAWQEFLTADRKNFHKSG
jgi:hypothetical protein